jgi:hypothetical protein
VPARRLDHHREGAPPPELWWLLFRGASRTRRELEAPPAEDTGGGMKAALDLIKPGAKGAPIGDAPGVYEAPEVRGVYWPQVGLTLLAGSVAVALGSILYELLGR